jgi:predicted nuclease with TOPRIM domain
MVASRPHVLEQAANRMLQEAKKRNNVLQEQNSKFQGQTQDYKKQIDELKKQLELHKLKPSATDKVFLPFPRTVFLS